MKAQIKKDKTFELPYTRNLPIHTQITPSNWSIKVELFPSLPEAKTRKAFVYVNIHGSSAVWTEAVVVVNVPANLPHRNASFLALHKAYKLGVGYSWVMWARKRIKEKYSSLSKVESFSRVLRNLASEWMPRISSEGRRHIEQVLKLGDFTSSAYPIFPSTATIN
jgi:hypothetical protein